MLKIKFFFFFPFYSMWEINENHRPCDYKDIWNAVWRMDDRPSSISEK